MTFYQLSIANRPHSLKVDSRGCRITELVLDNKPVFWSGIRPDEKFSATHPCLPQFGKVTEGKLAQLPQHGPSRNEEWKKVKYEAGSKKHGLENRVVFTWDMSGFEGIYPKGLVVRRIFTLSEEGVFTLETMLENKGDTSLPVNPGEHCYFTCPESERSAFKLNGTGVDAHVWPITEYRELSSRSTLDIPSVGALTMEVEGYQKCALWSVPGADFLCCEPIMGEPDEVYNTDHRLDPGQSKTYMIRLVIAK